VDQFIILILVPIFFAISFVYSSVGFAGGSSYTAMLVLVGVPLSTVPQISLLLNIIVSVMTFFNYVKGQHLSLRLSLPFMSSIPFALFSGILMLSQKTLLMIFIVALFAASAALLVSASKIKRRQQLKKINFSKLKIMAIGIPVGAFLGFIAGIVGIGGGIWLSPLLILTGLANPKQAAAAASLFILTNSIRGFIGHSIWKSIDFSLLIPLGIVVLAGGLIGSRFGAFKFDHNKIKMIVAGVVAVAGIELSIKFLS
jgi:uncharacterized membrane protein YfcA